MMKILVIAFSICLVVLLVFINFIRQANAEDDFEQLLLGEWCKTNPGHPFSLEYIHFMPKSKVEYMYNDGAYPCKFEGEYKIEYTKNIENSFFGFRNTSRPYIVIIITPHRGLEVPPYAPKEVIKGKIYFFAIKIGSGIDNRFSLSSFLLKFSDAGGRQYCFEKKDKLPVPKIRE